MTGVFSVLKLIDRFGKPETRLFGKEGYEAYEKVHSLL